MRTTRSLCGVVIILSALAASNAPASALSQQQWTNVCMNFLGLRSGATQVDTNGAGYGMDNGNTVPLNCLQPAPQGWDTLLDGTLTTIKNFPNSGPQYLLIVGGCPGLSPDYSGTFPKCNSVTGGVIAATPNTLANYTVPQLINWVNQNIP
jgi:hypothetical protein